METDRYSRYAPTVLRIGLAVLYLWFGLSELTDPAAWTAWVPAWATGMLHLDARTIVLLNGSFETVIGALLAFGIWVRALSALAALHMLLIVFDIGLNEIGMRDLAIAVSTFALSLFGADSASLEKRL